jgi:hypothetical protein
MSQIAMCLVDAETEWWGDPHASEVDVVLGALAAEPETLGELEAAMQRFARPGETIALEHWAGKQRNLEQGYDAGLCVVHLPARMIACQSTYSDASRAGAVWCGEREEDGRDVWAPYHLPEDWTFIDDVDHWRAHADALAKERLATPALDARPVLYDRVCEVIVDECRSVQNDASQEWTPPPGWRLKELAHRYTTGWHQIEGEPLPRDVVAEIHARWLMSPRADLQGQTPREVLIAQRQFLSQDLEGRAQQWSSQGACPPPLHPETVAYHYAGFGTHEFLVYYDLLRELLWECWERQVARWEDDPRSDDPDAGRWVPLKVAFDRDAEIAHLCAHRDRWLATPNVEDFGGEAPGEVIDRERRRIPATGSPHEYIIDDDCPLCQMMADMPGPVFWHLDGCNNDDDFPFSWIHDTYEEWEEEQRQHEELARQYEERRRLREAGLLEEEEDDPFAAGGIWQHSYAAPPMADTPASMRLFGIGSHLAELVEDLKSDEQSACFVDRLNRCFGNLTEIIETRSGTLLEPSLGRLCDELGAASDLRPDLAAKCADLARQLRDLRRSDVADEDELPF